MKKLLICSFALLVILVQKTNAQLPNFEWAGATDFTNGSQVSSEYGNTIVADTLGNVYSVGVYSGTVDFDPGPGQLLLTSAALSSYIIKMDGPGNLLWAKSIGDSGTVQVGSLANDSLGNLYLSGAFTKTTDFDPGPGVSLLTKTGTRDGFVLKLDQNGNFIWAKSFGGTLSYMETMNLTCDKAGNVFATANFNGTVDADPNAGVHNMVCTSTIYPNFFILKLDPSGNFLWTDVVSGTNMVSSYSLATDNAGSLYATGSFIGTADFDPGPGVSNLTAAGNSADAFILKLNASNGNLDWTKAIGSTSMETGMVICTDHQGNVYTSGPFGATVDFDPGAAVYNVTAASVASDIFLLKLTSEGKFLWVRTWTIDGCGNGYYCATDALNNVYMTGNYKDITDLDPGVGVLNYTTASPGVSNIFMLKLDTAGILAWGLEMGSTANAYGYSVVVANDFSIFSTGVFNATTDFDPGAGTTFLPASDQQMYMHKMSQTGISGVNEQSAAASVLVYPNPGNGIFNLTVTGAGEKEFRITDALGQEIMRKKMFSSNEKIDLSNAPAGIYFLMILGEKPQVVKLLKEN